MNVTEVKSLADEIRHEVGRAIVGQDEAVELMLIALFSSGHILLEGPPGTAKTFLAQCFARVLGLDFGRVQFTPDLMPGDILGSNLFNFQTSQFTLTRGPIFCDLLLADEINRTPPKTQAALLEAMQERAVTIDGETYKLGERFMVIATQNPIEQQGVYPLPEAQLDRFLFKHVMGYPSAEEERKIVANHGARLGAPRPADWGIEQKVGAGRLAEAVAVVAAVPMVSEVVDYIVALVRATREAPDLQGGASPRAAAMLAGAARARATLQGRDYVIPDDVKALAPAVLRHRVLLSAAAEIEGRPVESIVARLIDEVGAPPARMLRGTAAAVGRARKLRRKLTLPEGLLWRELRKRQTGFRFRKQHPAGPFTLDFACLEAKLAIEIDGEAHERGDRPIHDAARDEWLANQGFRTLRIPASDVLKDVSVVVTYIRDQCQPLHRPADGPPPRAGEERK